jgi:hypothetical protein
MLSSTFGPFHNSLAFEHSPPIVFGENLNICSCGFHPLGLQEFATLFAMRELREVERAYDQVVRPLRDGILAVATLTFDQSDRVIERHAL